MCCDLSTVCMARLFFVAFVISSEPRVQVVCSFCVFAGKDHEEGCFKVEMLEVCSHSSEDTEAL